MEAYSILEQLLAEIGSEYYVLGNIKEIGANGCMITLLMQTVSYRNGVKYLDNNENIVKFLQYLEGISNRSFVIKAGVYFTGTSSDEACYV